MIWGKIAITARVEDDGDELVMLRTFGDRQALLWQAFSTTQRTYICSIRASVWIPEPRTRSDWRGFYWLLPFCDLYGVPLRMGEP